MVLVDVSKLGLHQFDIRRSRSQGAYYRDMLLTQQLLPAIRQVSGVLKL